MAAVFLEALQELVPLHNQLLYSALAVHFGLLFHGRNETLYRRAGLIRDPDDFAMGLGELLLVVIESGVRLPHNGGYFVFSFEDDFQRFICHGFISLLPRSTPRP